MKKSILILLTLFLFGFSDAQIPYPDTAPGVAKSKIMKDGTVILENKVLRMKFNDNGKIVKISEFLDKKNHEQIITKSTEIFEISLRDGSVITSDDFTLSKTPIISTIIPDTEAFTYAERLGGRKYEAELENQKSGLKITWKAELRDDANYVRQLFTISAKNSVNISKIILLKFPVEMGVRREGTADGSPMVHKNMFFAIEHPLGEVEQTTSFVANYLLQSAPVISGQSFSASTVWGTTPVGQLRRGFLYYIERERSTPYRQMLHYNSWYDISWGSLKFTEAQALDRIEMFRDSLIIKRKVKMDAFLFDDGWDDNATLWRFNAEGFPDGFRKLKEVTGSCNSSVGVWLSPFGGYGATKAKRIEYGNNQNPPFETNAGGFSLAGPVYYQRFIEVARNFIKDYDISMFKFDGVGHHNNEDGAEIVYRNDIEAFIGLLRDLKKNKPELYLDLTTGTWPSVFWLMYGDNTWRSGGDCGQAGEGSFRQKSITFRDANTYKNVVLRGPLYPLNALMNGGLIIADNGLPGKFEMSDNEISDDIWAFFGTGVSLQELYVNPHKLNTASWNCLARACEWAKQNEDIMPDVHWVGGDPGKSEIYGYAAWSPHKAYIMLRNPSKEKKTFQYNVTELFELPKDDKNGYLFFDVISESKNPLAHGKFLNITLNPFEVKVLNAFPEK